ncbi:hypothetical protein FGB62_124g05 [Gracilaria domingensis]|nr:hypothetical protein FGB62_124g05 [Gracilaria domingensis]
MLHSRVNDKYYQCGTLSTPSLAELRAQTCSLVSGRGNIVVKEVVANVQLLHQDPALNGAVFQVASQFNLLENNPRVDPEMGVGRYQFQRTQGPACALACGAGTIFRNYFAEHHGQIGQDSNKQIDCTEDLGKKLGNEDNALWKVKNGYLFAKEVGLRYINDHLRFIGEDGQDELRGLLRIGVQEDTEETLADSRNIVTQVFCSALSVAYSRLPVSLWESFAKLVLEAAYESTLRVALLARERTGCNKVFLTMLGGGVFGNRIEWIVDAMERAIRIASESGLEVTIVSYGKPCAEIRRILTS